MIAWTEHTHIGLYTCIPLCVMHGWEVSPGNGTAHKLYKFIGLERHPPIAAEEVTYIHSWDSSVHHHFFFRNQTSRIVSFNLTKHNPLSWGKKW